MTKGVKNEREEPVTSVNIYESTLEQIASAQRTVAYKEKKDYTRCDFVSRVIEAGLKTLKLG